MDIGPIQPGYVSPGSADTTLQQHSTTQPVSTEKLAQQRELIQAVKALNGTELFGQNTELTFVFDRETRRALVRVVDKKTRQVTLQIPPEYVLRMAEERKRG